jgi:hypothetical protein
VWALIKFVLVADDSRERGVATRLVEACRERWPGAGLTPAVTRSGSILGPWLIHASANVTMCLSVAARTGPAQ